MKANSLTGRVIRFSRFLKDHGFKVFSSNIVDALRGLDEISILRREDFYSVLRANLVTTDMEWRLFEKLFDEFWQDIIPVDGEEEPKNLKEQNDSPEDTVKEFSYDTTFTHTADGNEESPEKEMIEGVIYSPLAGIEKKDIEQIRKEDILVAQLILKNMISPFRIAATRRFSVSKRPGQMDFRRIMKKSIKAEGIPLELFYKKKRKKLKRLVILSDVSGSMDRYARFVMPFILGLKGVGTKVEAFVFSTSLTPITSFLRHYSIDEALERISHKATDWSGGTRIGYSLHQFNQMYGERILSKRTVVVIMSDGWDLGGKDLLKREMATLNRKAYSVIWLNPLAGDPEYRPICQGMKTALPYVDHFLPADSLQSLKRVGHTLSRIMVH